MPISSSEVTWLIVEEAAEYLRCGERLVREVLANREIPHVMFGGKALFHRASLDSWLLGKQTGGEGDTTEKRKGGKTMIEADMERLVRDYPDEFFEEPLNLLSQQEAFRSGITDLVFEDSQGDILVVELKRGVLQREHIAQVIDYLEDVENRYKGKNVELMVVANIIPPQRKTKLERLGVSFKEIPEARFIEVAQKHGVEFALPTSPANGGFVGDRIPVIDECPRATVTSKLMELIDYGERFVSGLGHNLKRALENSDYRWLPTKEYAQLSRWCHPNRHTEREQWVIPRAHEISRALFGRVIDRTPHPSYGS